MTCIDTCHTENIGVQTCNRYRPNGQWAALMDNLVTYIRHIPTSCYWCLNRHLCILQGRFAKKKTYESQIWSLFFAIHR